MLLLLLYSVSGSLAATCGLQRGKHSTDTRGARPVRDDFLATGNWGAGAGKGLGGLGVVVAELLAFLFALYSDRI